MHCFTAIRCAHDQTLIVHGSVLIYTDQTEVTLSRAEPQGINPKILLLDLRITEKPGPMKGVPFSVCYEEGGPSAMDYTSVQIVSNKGDNLSVEIKSDHYGELVGRPLRAYKTGDAITKDLRPARVNIETGQDNTIVSVWFG